MKVQILIPDIIKPQLMKNYTLLIWIFVEIRNTHELKKICHFFVWKMPGYGN